MAAPDLETLLDFETNVENAAQIFLATDTGLSASSINLTLDQDELELPRLEVKFDLGEAIDPPDPKTTGSAELEYRKYTGVLNVMVMTRATLDGSETSHRTFRAKVRSALLLNALNFSGGTPDAMVVEDAGSTDYNGVYPKNGTVSGKPFYGTVPTEIGIFWDDVSSFWVIGLLDSAEFGYYSSENVANPSLVTTWEKDIAIEPLPTVRRATWADIDAAGIDRSTVPLLP